MGRKVVFLSLLFMLVYSCFAFAEEAKPARSWPESVDEVVGAVKKSITLVDMEAFKKVVENKGDAVIIDVREPEEFASGHVPGSINIPRGLAEFKIWKMVAGYPEKQDTSKKIYVYCAISGRAALTAKALKDVGFKDVTAVNMKMADWVKAGHPVER
jgi:rhodanese-related sulfurtransferase